MVKEKLSQTRYSKVFGFESKESDDALIKGGYVATTHLDSGFYDDTRQVYVRDTIAKETLDLWANEINEGIPRANKVSVNHNRTSHPAGVGIKGSARVEQLKDGHFGLYVDSMVDKTREDYEEIKYRIDNGFLDSFSIEYMTKDSNGNYMPGAVEETVINGGIQRTLLPGTEFNGWTFASRPMNDNAVMIKEIIQEKKEDTTMSEEQIKQDAPVEEPVAEETKVEEEESTEEKPVEEEAKAVEEEPKVEEPAISEEEKEVLKAHRESKELKAKEAKEKKLVDAVTEQVKENLKSVEVKEKVKMGESKKENKFSGEFKEMLEGKSRLTVREQFRIAGKIAESKGLIHDDMKSKVGIFNREYKASYSNMSSKMEYKLGITSNQNTDTDYLLSAAELQDIFDPVIYNALNQSTTTWNLLAKDDYSAKGNNQVQFKVKTAANTTAAAYTGNAVNTGNVTRLKVQTKFKKYQVGVEVDGDMIAAANPSDVFAMEVADSAEDLMAVINTALFAEVGLETAAGVIGFEYITDSAGNTTLYNLTRTSTTLSANKFLAPDSAGDTYINGGAADITLANLRAAKRQAVTEGAMLNNLVFVTSYIQGDKFRAIYDAIQRVPPTSSRFGFEGRPEFDGIPIFEDKDCNDDDWFLIDLESHRVAIWVPPTLEMLGKDSDSEKGFIKTYFATYNTRPRAMVQIYNNATA